jgi:hypothetical protein
MTRWKKKLAISVGTFVACALIAWLSTIVWRSRTLYAASKEGSRGWRGRIYKSDAELGLAPIPGATASETFPILPDVPSHVDSRGFRSPCGTADEAPLARPLFLALGCSSTFGSCVLAEETFSWRVARHFGGTSLNAGICSGSAAQELLLARKLIPEYRPDYVLLQYSPWLLERARTEYAPTFTGTIPVPFFVTTPAGVRLQPPLFETRAFDVPTGEYRSSERGFVDFLGFTLRVGVPLLAHDDLNTAWVRLRHRFGSVPACASPAEIESFVYPEIAKSCAEHGAKLIIVAIENGSEPWTVPATIANLGAPIAYGTNLMRERLPVLSRENYNRAYLFMAGDPPVLIDAHPNAHAHSIIAESVIEAIERAR